MNAIRWEWKRFVCVCVCVLNVPQNAKYAKRITAHHRFLHVFLCLFVVCRVCVCSPTRSKRVHLNRRIYSTFSFSSFFLGGWLTRHTTVRRCDRTMEHVQSAKCEILQSLFSHDRCVEVCFSISLFSVTSNPHEMPIDIFRQVLLT